MARNITEILDNANSATELQELIDLWNEIANNKKQYPLTEIYEANKQIRRLALKSKGEDIEIGKFYNFLDAQRYLFLALAITVADKIRCDLK